MQYIPANVDGAGILRSMFLNKGDLVTIIDKHGRTWTERVAEDTPLMFPVQTVPLRDRTEHVRRVQKVLAGILDSIPRFDGCCCGCRGDFRIND